MDTSVFWKRTSSALVLAFALLPSPAVAQTALEGIVIEGVTLDQEPVPAEYVGAAVTVVTREDLQRQQIRHAADALRSLPGVSVNQAGSFGAQTQIRIRGAEGNHTLVLIDGIEANATATGEFDFSDLAAEDIERIEVIRGPQSGLYGSHALGGVVNIITRTRRGPLQATAFGEGGSFDTANIGATVSGGDEKGYGAVTVSRFETDGFNVAPFGNEDDGATLNSVSAKAGVKLFPNFSLDGTLRAASKSGDRDDDGGLPGQLATQVDSLSTFDTDLFLAGVEATLDTFDGKWVHKWRGQYNETDRGDLSVSEFGAFPFDNLSKDRKAQYLSTILVSTPGFLKAEHKFTGMLEARQEGFTPSFDNISRKRDQVSAVGEYRGVYFQNLTLEAAVRNDDNDEAGVFTTWRTGGSLVVPNTPFRAHASAGTAVKYPTLFEQFGVIPSSFLPNPDLIAEESFGWDAGLETTLARGKLVFDVTYFDQDLQNEIATLFLPNFLSTVVNLEDDSRREGVEVGVTLKPYDWLHLAGAYTYLDAFDPTGLTEIRRPRHAGRADVTWLFGQGRGNVRLSAIYNGETKDLAFLLPQFAETLVTLDDYVLLRLAAAYKLTERVELFGRVENLLDDDYQEVFGFETAGVAAYGGLRVTLGGD